MVTLNLPPLTPARPHDDGVSRLDRMLARLAAQKVVLEAAAAAIMEREGPVVEIGLGKGRTYDHLRRLMPGREIFVFDGSVHCPPDCRPPADRLTLGDFRETLADAERLKGRAVLVHADFGTEDPARDAAMAAALAGPIVELAAPGGLVACDRVLDDRRLSDVTPDGMAWPYRLWRVAG